MIIFVSSVSAQQGRVVLTSNTNYEVQIDNRIYNDHASTTLTTLAPGSHTVAVYQVVSRGIFGIGKKRNQLSFEQFILGNDNLNIAVNQNGQIRISRENYSGKNSQSKRDRDYNSNRHGGNEDYGKSEGKGIGHKYGHYKNKKNKGYHKREHDDDDDDHDEHHDNRGKND